MSAQHPTSGLEGYLDVEEREQKGIQKDNLKRLSQYILRRWGLLLIGLALILLGTMAALLEPRLLGYAIDDAIVPKDWQALKTLVLIFFGVECVRVISVIGHSYLFSLLGQKVVFELRQELISHLSALPVAVYDKQPAGRLVTRVTNDIGSLAEMFTNGFVAIIGNVLTVLGILAWLLYLDLELGLISMSIFPVLIVASVYFSNRLKISYRNARSKLSALNAFLAENILGMRVVNLFNRQKLHLDRFARVNQWYTDAQIGTVRVFSLFQPTITWCSGISLALVIYYGGMMTFEGTLKLGVLVAFYSYVLAAFQPMREIADKWNTFLSGMASAERIFSILDWATEEKVHETQKRAEPIADLQGHIVFENVWFAYEGEHWILKDFSLEIKPGMKVGVVGHTGAGKTTLISLLLRFYEPQKGRILIDGKDLREYDKRALRASIGIVQQDVFVFSGSLKDNVSLWRDLEPKSEAWVRETLGSTGMEANSAVELNERGSNLSMGQRQVLAFARALAVDPRIWILDEATANIDSDTEQVLDVALATASSGRTTILIAHRLATVKDADLILVLHKGQLVEHGNHSALMRQEGFYTRLYRYQAVLDQDASAGPGGP